MAGSEKGARGAFDGAGGGVVGVLRARRAELGEGGAEVSRGAVAARGWVVVVDVDVAHSPLYGGAEAVGRWDVVGARAGGGDDAERRVRVAGVVPRFAA